MIPFTVPQIELEGFLNFSKAFIDGRWNKGSEIEQLEKEIAQFVGVKYAIAFASGRYALYLLYTYFGCRGKRVVVPAYTCIPAADAFRWAGAEPLFVDIGLDTYNPRYDDSIRDAENVGAVCLSYLYGLVGDPAPFVNWARSKGIPVIEDAAIALGAKVHGKMVGSIGNAAVFSLQSSKIITGWRGGIITTDNRVLYEFLKQHQKNQTSPFLPKVLINGYLTMIRRFLSPAFLYSVTMYPLRKLTLNAVFAGLLKGFLDQNPGEGIDGRSPHCLPAFERHYFTNAQARLALISLGEINRIMALRRKNAAYLINGLKEIQGVNVPSTSPGVEHAYGRFPIRIDGLEKTQAAKAFARIGVEVGIYYQYIIPETQYFIEKGYADKNFPNACKAARETILLPFHTYLQQRDLDYMIAAVHQVVRAAQRQKSRSAKFVDKTQNDLIQGAEIKEAVG